jgi:hypothetical protein
MLDWPPGGCRRRLVVEAEAPNPKTDCEEVEALPAGGEDGAPVAGSFVGTNCCGASFDEVVVMLFT